MAICDRYTNKQDDAVEILNDGFPKVFKDIHNFRPAYADVVSSFKGWLRKIMIYTAIDHFRKYHKHQLISKLDDVTYQLPPVYDDAVDKLSYEERWNVIHYIRSLQAATKKLEYSEKVNTFNNIEVPYAVLAAQKAAQTVVANAEVAVDTMMVKEVGGEVNQH